MRKKEKKKKKKVRSQIENQRRVLLTHLHFGVMDCLLCIMGFLNGISMATGLESIYAGKCIARIYYYKHKLKVREGMALDDIGWAC